MKGNILNQFTRETLLYKKRSNHAVTCGVCERQCNIPSGKQGYCKTRENRDGTLYSLTYGCISSISNNPIEKKPFFHFYPGSLALTIGSWSCNFNCPWCQNYGISKKQPRPYSSYYYTPEAFVDLLNKSKSHGTSFSFNEPTISLFEYSLDVMPIARSQGYYNTYVTNGYMTEEALNLLINHGLDAMNIDIKGGGTAIKRYCGIDIEHVWNRAKQAKEKGIHVEITTLIIPGMNDSTTTLTNIARRIHKELGEDTPWHCTRFHPAYQSHTYGFNYPTPTKTLEKTRHIAQKFGLKYHYIGNVPNHPYENTHCPTCNEPLIIRSIFWISKYSITKDKKCPKCNTPIPITGTPQIQTTN